MRLTLGSVNGLRFLSSTSMASLSVDVISLLAVSTHCVGRNLLTDCFFQVHQSGELEELLEKKGVIKTKQQATRDQLLAYMRDSYTSTVDNVWEAWSDSYIVSSMVHVFLLKFC